MDLLLTHDDKKSRSVETRLASFAPADYPLGYELEHDDTTSPPCASSNGERRDLLSPHGSITFSNVLTSGHLPQATFDDGIRTRMSKPMPPEKASIYKKIHQQIDQHDRYSRSLSYLGKALDVFCESDQESLAMLQELQITPFTGNATQFEEYANFAIQNDVDGIATQTEVNHYGSAALKSAALCLKGPQGVASAAGIFAIDQMRPEDPIVDQAIDGLLGGTKGALTHHTLSEIAASGLPYPSRSFSTGVAGRTLDRGLDRQNYYDQNGVFDHELGFKRTLAHALDMGAITRDTVSASTSNTVTGSFKYATGGFLSRNPFINNVAAGTTNGATSGFVTEIFNECDKGGTPDLSRVLWRSGMQATISGLARVPSGINDQSTTTAGVSVRRTLRGLE